MDGEVFELSIRAKNQIQVATLTFIFKLIHQSSKKNSKFILGNQMPRLTTTTTTTTVGSREKREIKSENTHSRATPQGGN